MYKFTREYSIGFLLFIHWLVYMAVLLGMINDEWNWSGKLLLAINYSSIGIFSGLIILIHRVFETDYNGRFINACIFTLFLRSTVYLLKPYGFDDSREIMIGCGVGMIVYFIVELLYEKSKRKKLYF